MKPRHQILIVDDDIDDREIVRDAFASVLDGEFIFLENGERLTQFLEANAGAQLPSLILLDLNMPGKDGREALKEIKADPRFCMIPTIVFTTSSSQRDRNMSYELGANCFLTKPDTFNKLVELTGCISRLWLQ